jgi:hypothetical protein
MNLNTRLHILGHVALKLALLAGALGIPIEGATRSTLAHVQRATDHRHSR